LCCCVLFFLYLFFFFQAEDGIRDATVTGVQTCALPILMNACAIPELMLGLDSAIQAGDTDKVRRLEQRLQEFIEWLNRFPAPVRSEERRVGKECRSRWWEDD